MRHAYAQMSPARCQAILDECRVYGRMGAPRLPDSVHAHADELSDTLLTRALDEHAVGAAERGEMPK